MALIKLKILNAAGQTLAASETDSSVSLVYSGVYQPGDWISLESNTAGTRYWVQFEDSISPAIIYLPEHSGKYVIPPQGNRNSYSPKSFAGNCHLLRAKVLDSEESSVRRNLALNPYDGHNNHGIFPHAEANVETRDEAVFAARNAIDGIFQNNSHGDWPYQSWGINQNSNAEYALYFGQPVLVEELRLTLRADFPHDSWWTQITVEFSDHSREILHLQKTAVSQSFSISSRKVEWLILKNLVKADDFSPFPALTQLEVYGYDLDSHNKEIDE